MPWLQKYNNIVKKVDCLVRIYFQNPWYSIVDTIKDSWFHFLWFIQSSFGEVPVRWLCRSSLELVNSVNLNLVLSRKETELSRHRNLR